MASKATSARSELKQKSRAHRLIEGRMMICPRCKNRHDVLRFVPLMQIEEFQAETTPIYKCPSCRWIFAPADGLITPKEAVA